jgi:hypothetical protein
VSLEAVIEIGGFTDVEGFIGASENVHEVHDDDDAIVRVMNATSLAPFKARALRLASLAQGILPERGLP